MHTNIHLHRTLSKNTEIAFDIINWVFIES